jgi:DNA-binding transcriptional MerR regulator
MTVTDAQVRIMMRERRKGKTQEQAAAKGNIGSRKTVRKYERLGKLPSEMKEPRNYRTREDPFEEDWDELERMLETAPELEAKTLFEWLCEREPGKYQEGQLRTLQRRVSNWRALSSEKLLTLDQTRQPGEVLQSGDHHRRGTFCPYPDPQCIALLELGVGASGAVRVPISDQAGTAKHNGETRACTKNPPD